MKAQDVVNQLAKIVPRYTSGFSAAVGVQSATVAGTTVTVTTDAAHNLQNDSDGNPPRVSITGINAPVQIDTASFLRVGSSATFETLQDHDLTLSERDKANGGKTIAISGANEAEFNGAFQLIGVGVPNRRKLIIAVADAGPTTISGSPLVDNANGSIFNGLVAAAITGPSTFTYELAQAYPLDGVTTGAVVQVSIRVLSVLDIEQYLRTVYTKKLIGADTLVVQLGDVTASKNRNEESDAGNSSSAEYAYTPTLIQPFAVYVIQNVTDDLTAAAARDKVESEYVPAIFHAVLRAPFNTGFTYSGFRATFTGHGVFAYSEETSKNTAIYVHEITFEQLAQITSVDTVERGDTVAMRDVSYTLNIDQGTGEALTANVNLDNDAEPAL